MSVSTHHVWQTCMRTLSQIICPWVKSCKLPLHAGKLVSGPIVYSGLRARFTWWIDILRHTRYIAAPRYILYIWPNIFDIYAWNKLMISPLLRKHNGACSETSEDISIISSCSDVSSKVLLSIISCLHMFEPDNNNIRLYCHV